MFEEFQTLGQKRYCMKANYKKNKQFWKCKSSTVISLEPQNKKHEPQFMQIMASLSDIYVGYRIK